MSFIQQKNKFKIVHDVEKKQNKKSLIAYNIRCIIAGPSGCGKMVVMYNLFL
jgi:ABC-type sugar transport system ATPase subunit